MPAASTKSVKRVGKENAPPPRSNAPETEDDFDAFDADMAPAIKSTSKTGVKGAKAGKSKAADEREASEGAEQDDLRGNAVLKGSEKANGAASGSSGLQKRLDQMTAERDRLRSQRDTFAKQFEELSNLRQSGAEKLLQKHKEKTELQSQAQNDIIASLTTLNEKHQARIKVLEDQARSDAPKPDPKETRLLKEQLDKAKSELKAKSSDYEKLEKEYQTEKAYSQNLQASRPTASAAPVVSATGSSTEEAAKDLASLRIYEDITDLNIINVKIKEGKHGKTDKEYTFNCLLTAKDGMSVNFRLRAYNKLDLDRLAAKSRNPYDPVVDYVPDLARETNRAMLDRLGIFREEFQIPRDQLNLMFQNLRRALISDE